MNLLSEPKNVPVRENGSFLSKRSASAWKNGVTEEQFPSILPSKPVRHSTRTTTASMHRLIKYLTATSAVLSYCTIIGTFSARAANSNQLEVFSYWTSGSEASALDALFQVFKQHNPNVEVVNAAIAGGSGSAAMPVLQTRLAGGNPPDTWQSHPGQELLSRYVDPGFCQDVTSIYESENWNAVVPKSLIDQLSSKGKIYSVMTGVHRLNVLWYNKKVLDKNGIKIGDKFSFADFFAAAEKLKAAGITPLAVGDSGIWASGDILENALLAKVGPKDWADLFNGKLSWDSPKVKEALTLYGKILGYQNQDHSALSWDQAIKAVIDGRCAFSVMGDWSFGEFLKANQKENQDFGWVAFPETDLRTAHSVARRLSSVMRHTSHGKRDVRSEPVVTLATMLPSDSPKSLLARLADEGQRAAS